MTPADPALQGLDSASVVRLAELLRAECFDFDVHKLLDAQRLLLDLCVRDAVPRAPGNAWLPWLRPLFCTRADQRPAFDRAFARWLAQQPAAAGVDDSATPSAPQPRPALPRPAWRHPAVLAALAIFVLASAVLAWRIVPTLQRCAWGLSSDCGQTQSPYAEKSGKARAVPASPRADLGSPKSAQTGDSTDRLTMPAASSASAAAAIPAKRPASAALPLVSSWTVPLDDLVPPLSWQQRLQRLPLLAALVPWLALALWWAWRRQRTPQLVREATRLPPQLRWLHLPEGARALLAGWPLRRLERALRARQWAPSSALRVHDTLDATIQRAGQFTPVYGSRVEAETLALIDRSSAADHQAQLAATLVADMARADVAIQRFDTDERLQRMQSHDARSRASRAARAGRDQRDVLSLDDLAERFPQRRVLLFSDGRALFDAYTGAPAAALRTLLSWPLAVLLTPRPVTHWGSLEAALQRRGVQVLPWDAEGVAALVAMLSGERRRALPGQGLNNPEEALGPTSLLAHLTPSRWVQRDAPSPEVVDTLVAQLQGWLGRPALHWLAATVLYPEVHWGVTLRLGRLLVPDAITFEAGLRRISTLPWLRRGYAPDWLRAALYSRLTPAEQDQARKAIDALLAAAAQAASDTQLGDEGTVPMAIATDAADGRPGAWRRRLQQLSGHAPPDSPLRDHVFLRFMRGRGRLALDAPPSLVERLRAAGVLGRAAGLALCASASLLSASLWPVWMSGQAQRLTSQLWWSADAGSPAWLVVIDGVMAAAPAPQDLQVLRYSLVRLLPPVREADTAATAASGASPSLASRWRSEVAWQGTEPVAVAPGARYAVRLGERQVEVLALGPMGTPKLQRSLPAPQRAPGTPARAAFGGVNLTFSHDGLWIAYPIAAGQLQAWPLAEAKGAARSFIWGSDAKDSAPTPRLLALAPGAVSIAAAEPDGLGLLRAWPQATGRMPDIVPVTDVQELVYASGGAALALANSKLVGLLGPESRDLQRLRNGQGGWPEAASLRLRSSDRGDALLGFGSHMLRWQQGNARADEFPMPGSPLVAAAEGGVGRLLATLSQDGEVTAYRDWGRLSGFVASAQARAASSDWAAPEAGLTAQLSIGPDGDIATLGAGVLTMWQAPAQRQWALVLGNNNPNSSSPLRLAVADARRVAAVLKQRFGYDVTLLEDASLPDAVRALQTLQGKVQPQDRVLLYMSGPGAEARSDWVYLLETSKDLAAAPNNNLTAIALLAWLRDLPAAEALLVVDSSSAASVASVEATQTAPAQSAPAEAATPVSAASKRARWLLAGAELGQLSMETEQGGVFSVAIVDVLAKLPAPATADQVTVAAAAKMSRRKSAQRPTLLPLPAAGHIGGSFTFEPKALVADSPSASASTPADTTSPEAKCAGRNPLSYFVCMERECLRSELEANAECKKWRKDARRG